MRAGGFTLIELVLVLAILGLATAVAVPAFTSFNGDERLDGTDGFVRLLESARATALARGEEVILRIEWTTGRYRVESRSSTRPIAEGRLAFDQGQRIASGSRRARYSFSGQGAASGPPVTIEYAGRTMTVTVDPWNGDVSESIR